MSFTSQVTGAEAPSSSRLLSRQDAHYPSRSQDSAPSSTAVFCSTQIPAESQSLVLPPGNSKMGCGWALTGGVSTIKFFLSEAFLGQHFEAVELESSEPEPGDLFLFRLMSPTGRWCGAHVGVYCGHGEIIHFEGKNPGGGEFHTCLGSWEGVVSKQGQRAMLRSRSLWRVLRRRSGVDSAALERRVRQAMDEDPPLYHPTRSNCVHFALSLLGPSPGLESLQIQRLGVGGRDLRLAVDIRPS